MSMKLLISQHQLQSRFVIIQSVQDVNHLAFSPDAYCVKLLLNCHTVAVRHASSHPPSSDIRIVLLRIKDVCETSHNPFLAAAGLRATRASMQRDICKSSFVDARLFFSYSAAVTKGYMRRIAFVLRSLSAVKRHRLAWSMTQKLVSRWKYTQKYILIPRCITV